MADVGSHYAQLVADGYCIVSRHECRNLSRYVSNIISDWFENASQKKKCAAAASATDVAAGSGRGYFAMSAKEVLETSQTWRGVGVGADLRLAAKSAFSTLQQVACGTAKLVLSQSNGYKVGQQQLKQLIGQQQSGHRQLHNSSILHVNKYRTAGPATAPVEEPDGGLRLQGCEAHVDKGLLTVIYATGPGLQVFSRDGSWIPVNPGPGQMVILVGHTLSFITAGRLPAALHRVVTPPAAGAGSNSSSNRLSLCFKLHAAPDALLSPDKVTGTRAGRLPKRYRTPKTTQQLLEEFDATHISIHSIADRGAHQQLAVEQPRARKRAPQPTVSPSTRSSTMQAHKRRRLQPISQTVPPANNDAANCQTRGLMSFTVTSPSGLDANYSVRPSTSLQRVLDAFSARLGVKDFRFLLNGRRVYPRDTPASCDMKDGDVIDAMLPQHGD